MKANDYQVGGTHYSKGGALQHWDFIEDHGFGYLEGYATKYIMRWRVSPTPYKDLNKSRHVIVKLKEKFHEKGRINRGFVTDDQLEEFFAANGLTEPLDKTILTCVFKWLSDTQLDAAVNAIDQLLPMAKQKQLEREHNEEYPADHSGR